jgi:hypothetical protein
VLKITQSLDLTVPGGPVTKRTLTLQAILRQPPSTEADAPSFAHGHFTLEPVVKGNEVVTGEVRLDYAPPPPASP